MAFPTLPPDWSYRLGLAFLEAAVSCEGVSCDRRFVSDGSLVEGLPPGCSCQLVAVVTEGYEAIAGSGGSKCGSLRTAEVRLILELCTVAPPGEKAVPDPVKINTKAQENAALRWGIMRGLRRAWQLGELSAIGEELGPLAASTCDRIIPAPWRLTRSTGGSARWEAAWRYRETI